MSIELSQRRSDSALAAIAVSLAAAGLVSEVAMHVYGDDWLYGLVPLVNLAYEGNLPTWYASILLFVCAVLLFLISRLHFDRSGPYRRHWLVLGFLFLYISIDEAAVIHEMLNEPLREAFRLGGVLYYGWVLPVGAGVLLVGLAYLGFLRHLGRRFRRWFVVSGAVYVGGALGTELPVSAWYDAHGGDNLGYGLLNLLQESMEIAGASLFCAALVRYIAAEFGAVRLELGK